MKRISTEEQQKVINSYKNGESVTIISKRTGIPQSTIYGWIKAEQPITDQLPFDRMKINNLERTGEKQKAMIDTIL